MRQVRIEVNPSEHPLHSSKTTNLLQWIAITCMAIGLITSNYYHIHILKAERVETELTSYLHLNDCYHKLLFNLIQNDSEIFKKIDDSSLGKEKYIMYELFDLFATVQLVENYFTELDKNVWPCWKQRMEFLFSKPAIRYAWQCHLKDARHIYKSEFIQHVENIIANSSL